VYGIEDGEWKTSIATPTNYGQRLAGMLSAGCLTNVNGVLVRRRASPADQKAAG
jgi:hypothetical protein